MLSLPRFRGLVFDLDGTLVDSRGDIVRACNFALLATGRAALDDAKIASFVGDGARSLLGRAAGLEPDDPAIDALLVPFMADYEAHPVERTTLLPDVMETLSVLARTLPLAVCTNKPRSLATAVLDRLGLSPFFSAIVADGDAKTRKPEPEMVLLACAKLGQDPSAPVAMVGDSPIDVRAGRAAGTFTIAVVGPFVSRESLVAASPDVFLPSFRGLLELMNERHERNER